MATKLEQRMAAERMAEDERGSKGKATAQIPASSEQKRKLKKLGLTGVLTVVPGGFILKGVKGASKVYKTIAAARKAAEAAGKKVSEVSKLTPQKGEAARLRNLNRAQTLKKKPRGEPAYKTLKREESREVAERTSKLSKKKEAENLKKLKEKQNKPTPPSKPKMSNAGKGVAALTATATGVGGLASLTKKDKKKRKVVGSGQTPATGYKKSKPKAKDAGRDSDLFDTPAGVTSGKKSSKFKDEGGKYKQYEWAKKLDPSDPRFQSGYMTQKGYDSEEMEAAKKGGQIKKLTKTKKVVKKKPASKKGFSGRGTGAALRGF